MKRCLTLSGALLALVLLAFQPTAALAQPAHSLGVRFTGGFGLQDGTWLNDFPSFGAELSYQHFFTPKSRLEADLGFRIYDIHPETKRLYTDWLIVTSYQWRWPIGRTAGFYAGPAVQYGFKYYWFGVGAQTGFDWQFKGPLQLSVDFRPTWSWWSGIDACLCFGIRYSFGSDLASRANLKSSSGK